MHKAWRSFCHPCSYQTKTLILSFLKIYSPHTCFCMNSWESLKSELCFTDHLMEPIKIYHLKWVQLKSYEGAKNYLEWAEWGGSYNVQIGVSLQYTALFISTFFVVAVCSKIRGRSSCGWWPRLMRHLRYEYLCSACISAWCRNISCPQLRFERLSWVHQESSVGWADFYKVEK